MAHSSWPLAWPWIHGDIVWMAALALALGVGLVRALGAPRRRGRRYATRQLARLRREHPAPTGRMVQHGDGLADGQVQVLVGHLRAAGAACESYDRGARVAASTVECPLGERGRRRHGFGLVTMRRRAEKLALELDGGAAVTLEGEIEVLVGSQQAHPRRRLHGLPRHLSERVYRDRPARIDIDALLQEPPVIRNLAGGDPVMVLGLVMAEGAGGDGPGAGAGQPYRAPAPQRWALRPAPTGDATPAIAALCVSPLAIPMSPWARFGLQPMSWLAGATAALAVIGALSLHVARQGDLVAIAPRSVETDTGAIVDANAVMLRRDRLPVDAPALAVAAATPFHRGAALDLLGRALARSEARGRALVEARVAVAELQGRCAAAAAMWREHRQPRRAIDAAERCVAAGRDAGQARHVLGMAWRDLGFYQAASAAFAGIPGDGPGPGWSQAGSRDLDLLSEHAVAHALAGAWAEAADALRRMAERGESSGNRLAYSCLAEAAAARAGDRDARALVESLARSSRSPVCALLAADLGQGEARRAWLADADAGWQGVPWRVHAADARGKQMLYVRELLLRELDTRDVGLRGRGAADTLRLLGAGVPGGDTPYETLPALEHGVLEQLHVHDQMDGIAPPTRRELVLRAVLTARMLGMEAHLGRPYAAASLRHQLLADVDALLAQSAPGDLGATWRSLSGDALLLAAVTHWRAGDDVWPEDQLEAAGQALERARALAPPALLERVESVLAFESRGELRASLADVLIGGPAGRGGRRASEDEVLAVARTGDGAALAELVEKAHVTPNAIGVLAPALATGRDQLLDVLRWGRARDAATVAESLWHEGARAFAAERLGDHALAQEARAAAHRRYQALGQRAPALLVYLIEHL